MDRRDVTVRVFDSVEAADEASREALRRMTGEERMAMVFAISGWELNGKIERCYRVIDCSQS
ncbi:MAG: hypothetical protein ACKVQS_08385 [Fimbriimonadaceae bacterium]